MFYEFFLVNPNFTTVVCVNLRRHSVSQWDLATGVISNFWISRDPKCCLYGNWGSRWYSSSCRDTSCSESVRFWRLRTSNSCTEKDISIQWHSLWHRAFICFSWQHCFHISTKFRITNWWWQSRNCHWVLSWDPWSCEWWD